MVIDDLIKILHKIRGDNSGNLEVVDDSENALTNVEVKENPFDEDAPPTVVLIHQKDQYDE